MKKNFKYYMHDGYDMMERIEAIEEQIGPMTSEQKDRIGRPFYEIELSCMIDLDTGEVQILSAK